MRFTSSKTCAIALVTALSMPAFSQGTTGSGSTTGSTGSTATPTTATGTDTTTRRDTDRGFDWGWLGLIGLAGLMGLRKQPDTHRVDPMRTSAQR
jgi:hypothetical protein